MNALKTILTIFCSSMLSANAAAQEQGMPYKEMEDPSVNSIGRLPARAYSLPLDSEKAALTDDLEPQTPFAVSLDGLWKYHWCGDPAQRPSDFYRTDFDDTMWGTIDVPSCVEMRGYGSPEYTNITYPHAKALPYIRDYALGTSDYNPVSSYRTTFKVPAAWKGRDVILRFDGVYSAYHVWVNGKMVGYAEDSKLPDEFNITQYIREGENLLAVEVFRWCDGSYLEDQDMFRFSGIFRSVSLIGMPKQRIEDFHYNVVLDGTDAKVKLSVKSGAKGVRATLYDEQHRKVASFSGAESSATIRKAHLWSAEDPYLYTLVIKSGKDIRSTRVGLKQVEIKDGVMLVNGKAVKIKGVNRHEHSSRNGRTLTLDEMTEDIVLMKSNNINAVRTSHYPDHHSWYDLCDRYGLYVIAEANVEGHGYGYDSDGLGLKPEWEKTIVERNANHVLNYRNHGCIVFWSLGNETGPGPGFKKAYDAVKALDPRPIHYERQNEIADIYSQMYYGVDWVERRGKNRSKPFFMCEYAHGMGNAVGNLKEYWDAFYSSDVLMGGCIWDWVDQALEKQTGRFAEDGTPQIIYAYGGDWDGKPNDGPFCCNGLVRPDRQMTAKLAEVRHVYRQIAVSALEDGNLEIWNRFSFTSTDRYNASWSLLEDGMVVDGSAWSLPSIEPETKVAVESPVKGYAFVPGKEYFLNVYFTLKKDELWADAGHIIAADQIPLAGKGADNCVASGRTTAPSYSEDLSTIRVENGKMVAIFCKNGGELSSLTIDGKPVLDARLGVIASPRISCNRALVDNDAWLRDGWIKDNGKKAGYAAYGLTQLHYHGVVVSAETSKDGSVVIKTCVNVTGSKSAGFREEVAWVFRTDGALDRKSTLIPFGHMPVALPRLGLSLILDSRLEQTEWYGRGPWENYIDRKTASFVGNYKSTVTDMYEDYIRPQDNGYRSDVRWIELTDEGGSGVRFSADVPLFVQALHYSWEDLDGARHIAGERRRDARPEPRSEIMLNLDIRQLGLGNSSCGGRPLDEYIFPIRPETWTLTISPASR